NKHIDHDLNVKYNNVKISVVNEGKFLGVWFDKKMTWKKHISELNKKLRRICGMINRYRNVFPFKVKRILYNSLFFAHLQYCSLAYGTAVPSTLKSILTTQKRFIRIMFNLKLQDSTH